MTKNKEPWGEGTPWKNSTTFFSYLRGCLRLAWKRHPTKLAKIKNTRYRIPNPNPNGRAKTVFGFKCEMCHNEYPMSECQVDHIEAAGKLNKTEDIQGFVERLLYVTEDDLRLVCKTCNSALSMSDKSGISFEEALVQKKVIAKMKLPKPQQDKILAKYGYPCNNDRLRKKGWRKLIENGDV